MSSYRVEFAAGAGRQFQTLPTRARDAVVDRCVDLAEHPWDAVVRPPGDDPRFREVVFGDGHGVMGFYVDENAEAIRIFDIVWIDTG